MATTTRQRSFDTAVIAVRRLMAELGARAANSRLRRPVPFLGAWSRSGEPGYRRLIGWWLLLGLIIVPSGMTTRLFEWTGVPLQLGGTQVHLTLYLPLIFCLPLVFWLGYLWAAIPAYLSTVCVAWLGGMPLGWILVFAFANPIGLAIPAITYRSFPARVDLRSVPGFSFYVVVMFVSSLAGSAGSFVWAHTNRVGLNELYPVWQGWWLGGFAQSVLIVAPILMVAGPSVEAWKRRARLVTVREDQPSRVSMMIGASALGLGMAAYVLVVRSFSLTELDRALMHVTDSTVRERIGNAFDGLALPLWIMVVFAGFTLIYGYRLGMAWATSLQRWSRSLRALNAKLESRAEELEIRNRQLYEASIVDSLTGVYTRGYVMDMLERELRMSVRHKEALTCMMIDVDHFKKVNDRYGHLVGDRVLQSIAERIGAQLRFEDLLARYGGEEFVVMLPKTHREGAMVAAERVRERVSTCEYQAVDRTVRVTVSIGVATSDPERRIDSVDALIQLADQALLAAKRQGRNCSVAAG